MTANPILLSMPLAQNGQKNVIPETQATPGNGLFSQSTGFPAETSLPLGAGGVAPSREDFNGMANLLGGVAFYAQKGWQFQFDAAQDYYAGCIVRDTTDGKLYECINDVAAGGSVPSADSTNWKEFSTGGGKSIGEIFAYGGTTQPEGALLCNHAAVSRTMYPDLFSEISTKYGAGDGSTTFNLPDLTDAIIPGNITKTKYETAGSATFTASKSGLYRITVKGAGGGGAGGLVFSGYYCAGGGGGEGGTTIRYEHLDAGDTVAVVVGAGGSGGAVNAGGVDGGDTSATVGLSTFIGGGGGGGNGYNQGQYGGIGGTGDIYGAPGACAVVASSNEVGRNGGGAGGSSNPANPGVLGGGGAGGGAVGSAGAGSAGGDGYVWIEYLGDATAYYIQAFNGSTDPALVDLTQILQDLANRLTREQTPAFNHCDVITTSGTYTAPVDGWYKITVKGGGGGGAGGNHPSTLYASGGAGGEGGTTIAYEKLSAGDTVNVVIGSGGVGGAAGAVSGSAGGNSSVTANNNTYTAGGGGGGGYPNGGNGGSGTINGNPGQTGAEALNANQLETTGGGAGGGASPDYPAVKGGGGYGGKAASTIDAGGDGGDGYVWFEYFASIA